MRDFPTYRRVASPLLLTGALLAGVSGCGGSSFSAPKSPEAATREFLKAVARGDGETACRLMTSTARSNFVGRSNESVSDCAAIVAGFKNRRAWAAVSRGQFSLGPYIEDQQVDITYVLDQDSYETHALVQPQRPTTGWLVSSPPGPIRE